MMNLSKPATISVISSQHSKSVQQHIVSQQSVNIDFNNILQSKPYQPQNTTANQNPNPKHQEQMVPSSLLNANKIIKASSSDQRHQSVLKRHSKSVIKSRYTALTPSAHHPHHPHLNVSINSSNTVNLNNHMQQLQYQLQRQNENDFYYNKNKNQNKKKIVEKDDEQKQSHKHPKQKQLHYRSKSSHTHSNNSQKLKVDHNDENRLKRQQASMLLPSKQSQTPYHLLKKKSLENYQLQSHQKRLSHKRSISTTSAQNHLQQLNRSNSYNKYLPTNNSLNINKNNLNNFSNNNRHLLSCNSNPTVNSTNKRYSAMSQNPSHSVHSTVHKNSHNGLKSVSTSKNIKATSSSASSNTHSSQYFSPYYSFTKEFNIILPTPKQKFIEFMKIAPFNRAAHHLELIQHFLKEYTFFRNHPDQILAEIAKKVRLSKRQELESSHIIVVQTGECIFMNETFKKGNILNRKDPNSRGSENELYQRHSYGYGQSSEKSINNFPSLIKQVPKAGSSSGEREKGKERRKFLSQFVAPKQQQDVIKDNGIFRSGQFLDLGKPGSSNMINGESRDGNSNSTNLRFITLHRHQYLFLIKGYFEKYKSKYAEFLANVQIFKMFPANIFERFVDSLTLNYYGQGEHLYRFGQDTNQLYIVFQGKATRKVIIEIDKMNKIPLLRYSKIVKILSKAYQHKIQFHKEDLIGITEVIDRIDTRKENIKIQKPCTIVLGLDKIIFQDNLDEYIIDRLRKYNLKKYPVTYDLLCEKYQREKTEHKEQQIRKIQALKDSIQTVSAGLPSKKNQKIYQIIKSYQDNIKSSQMRNLLNCKIQQRKVQRD